MQNIFVNEYISIRYHSIMEVPFHIDVTNQSCVLESVCMQSERLHKSINIIRTFRLDHGLNVANVSFPIDVIAGDMLIPAKFYGKIFLDSVDTDADGFVALEKEALEMLGVTNVSRKECLLLAAGTVAVKLPDGNRSLSSLDGCLENIIYSMLAASVADKSRESVDAVLHWTEASCRPYVAAVPFQTTRSGMKLVENRLVVEDPNLFGINICEMLLQPTAPGNGGMHKLNGITIYKLNGISIYKLIEEAKHCTNALSKQELYSRMMPQFVSCNTFKADRTRRLMSRL